MIKSQHVEYYKDGSVKGEGALIGGVMDGYWEWFRKNGVKLRSGYFTMGLQVGEWITYDQRGEVYKVTNFDKKDSGAS